MRLKFRYLILLAFVVLSIVFFTGAQKTKAAELFETYVTEDAWISSKFPNNNYGGAYQLFDFYESSDGSEGRALFKFDMSTIPANSTVGDAYIYLYLLGDAQSCYGQPAGNFYISQISSSWSENSVTWNNQPSTYVNYLNTVACTTGYRAVYFKNIAQGILNGEISNNGLMLIGLLHTNEWMRTIMSRENGQSYTAKISITYSPPSPSPTPTPTPAPSPTPVDPTGGTTSQTGISAGTGAAPSTKTSKSIKPPTDLLAENAADEAGETIKLTWKISESTDIDGYKIFRSEQEKDGFTEIALAEKGITEFIDKTVESGKTYYYFLRSYKGDAESESSNTVSAVSTIPETAINDDSQTGKSLTARDTYILLGASLLFFMAFLLFYELNWKKKLSR